jgi:DNA-binding response OmpR family regulator
VGRQERWVFDIADDGRARAISWNAREDGVSSKTPPDQGLTRHRVAGGDSPEAAQSAIRRQHRILVVEDSHLMADLICDSLQEAGYSIVGPAGTLQAGRSLARTEDFDAAVLDLELGHARCLPIASVLTARGIPFVILTGDPARLTSPGIEPTAWLIKPMAAGALIEAVERMLADRASGPAATLRLAFQLSVSTGVKSMTVSECITEPPSRIVASEGVFADKAARIRVLLVDGDPQTRAVLAALLAKRGLDVQSFDEHPALHGSTGQAGRSAPPAEKIAVGKLVIELPQRRAWWDGAEVLLTAGEFAIVVLLASRAGSCVDNRTVYDSLHYKGFHSGHGERGFWVNVRGVIRHVRKKFRALDSSFDELETVRGFGYRWRTPS